MFVPGTKCQLAWLDPAGWLLTRTVGIILIPAINTVLKPQMGVQSRGAGGGAGGVVEKQEKQEELEDNEEQEEQSQNQHLYLVSILQMTTFFVF